MYENQRTAAANNYSWKEATLGGTRHSELAGVELTYTNTVFGSGGATAHAGSLREAAYKQYTASQANAYADTLNHVSGWDTANASNDVAVATDPFGRPQFATQPGMEYRLQPR